MGLASLGGKQVYSLEKRREGLFAFVRGRPIALCKQLLERRPMSLFSKAAAAAGSGAAAMTSSKAKYRLQSFDDRERPAYKIILSR